MDADDFEAAIGAGVDTTLSGLEERRPLTLLQIPERESSYSSDLGSPIYERRSRHDIVSEKPFVSIASSSLGPITRALVLWHLFLRYATYSVLNVNDRNACWWRNSRSRLQTRSVHPSRCTEARDLSIETEFFPVETLEDATCARAARKNSASFCA